MESVFQIFKSPEFGIVRTAGTPENPLFCLTDICRALDLGNPSQVKTRLPDGVISNEVIIDNLGRKQNAVFVNEDGLYDVILDSRKPEARRFRKWITSEVIPQIRRTGGYSLTNSTIDYKALANNPDFIIEMGLALKAEKEKVKQLTQENTILTQQVAELKPKASYYDLVLKSESLVPIRAIAKDYGMSAQDLNSILHNLGVQFKQGGMWFLYQKYAQLGWTQSKTYQYGGCNGIPYQTKMHTYWTQVGRLGLYEILKANGCLPVIERENQYEEDDYALETI